MQARRWSPSRPIFEMVEAAFAGAFSVGVIAMAARCKRFEFDPLLRGRFGTFVRNNASTVLTKGPHGKGPRRRINYGGC
jgi:hypothetical protein